MYLNKQSTADNDQALERPVEPSIANAPKAKQSVAKKEASPEERKKAEETVVKTIGIEPNNGLNDLNETLKKAIRSLPRYQQIERKLASASKQNLPYELFKIIKKDSDDTQIDPNAPKDGVLIQSMKQGHLECAGRTLIASTLLQEHDVKHVVVSAPGHSFMIIEQSADTLVYFDSNNNLFFTFPRSALAGYKGTNTSSECKLKEYAPRDSDFSDGIGPTFDHFITMPAKEATGRQYLSNVGAALKGNKEFATSGIATDQETADAMSEIETDIYGKNEILETFYSRVDVLIKNHEAQTEEDKALIGKIMKDHPTRDDFVNFFTMILNGNIGNRIPYIKNTTPEKRKEYAEKVWNFLQKQYRSTRQA